MVKEGWQLDSAESCVWILLLKRFPNDVKEKVSDRVTNNVKEKVSDRGTNNVKEKVSDSNK